MHARIDRRDEQCPVCEGKGIVADVEAPELDPYFCKTCNGLGSVPEEEVETPAEAA